MVLQWCTNFSIIFSKIKSARLIICYHTENTRLIIWTNVVTILLDRGISERWTSRITVMILTCRSQLLQMDGPYCSGDIFQLTVLQWWYVVLSLFRWTNRIAAVILTRHSQLLQMDGPYCSDDYFKKDRIAAVIYRSQLLQMDGPYCSGVIFQGPFCTDDWVGCSIEWRNFRAIGDWLIDFLWWWC